MSLLYDEGQQAIATESRRIAEARSKPEALLALLETQGEYDAGFWTMATEQGWTALAIPEEHGGLGLSLIELGLVAFQAGRTLSGAPFLTSGYGAARALLESGNADLQGQWLPGLASGEVIGTVAFGEASSPLPETPSVSFAGGKLNGSKPGVLGGVHAGLAIVLASDGGTPVLVAAALDGVARTTQATFDNTRCLAELHFADTPASELARGQAALDIALTVLAAQAVVTAHEQTGGSEALMERARDYANTRRAFGQPIGGFQSVKHRIAELYTLVELSRANGIHAASRDGEADFVKAAAAARLSACEAYDTSSRDCVQVHGGIGATWEAGIHLHMRRARSLAVEQGNSFYWEDILVNRILGDVA